MARKPKGSKEDTERSCHHYFRYIYVDVKQVNIPQNLSYMMMIFIQTKVYEEDYISVDVTRKQI
jgi:hypothetical protein